MPNLNNSQAPARLGKNQEPEPLEKKSGAGAGTAKKLAGSPTLITKKRGAKLLLNEIVACMSRFTRHVAAIT